MNLDNISKLLCYSAVQTRETAARPHQKADRIERVQLFLNHIRSNWLFYLGDNQSNDFKVFTLNKKIWYDVLELEPQHTIKFGSGILYTKDRESYKILQNAISEIPVVIDDSKLQQMQLDFDIAEIRQLCGVQTEANERISKLCDKTEELLCELNSIDQLIGDYNE